MLATARSGDQHGRLDPRSADQHGSRAVAELLKDRGVSVRVITTLDEATAATGPDTTLLVTAPNLLTPHQQNELRAATTDSAGRTVLLAADPLSVDALAPGVHANSSGPVSARAPQCSLPAARTAGDADTGGFRYTADGLDTIGCYPSGNLPTLLLVHERGAGDTVLLGSPDCSTTTGSPATATPPWPCNSSAPARIWSGTSPRSLIPPPLGTTTVSTTARATSAASSTSSRPAGSGAPCNSQSPPCSQPSGAPADWAPWSPNGCPWPSAPPKSTEGRARLYRKANARDRAASVTALRHPHPHRTPPRRLPTRCPLPLRAPPRRLRAPQHR